MAQRVKNLPAVQETWVQSLGQDDSLQEEMATHSSLLVQRIPWTEEPGGASVHRGLTDGDHFPFSFQWLSFDDAVTSLFSQKRQSVSRDIKVVF